VYHGPYTAQVSIDQICPISINTAAILELKFSAIIYEVTYVKKRAANAASLAVIDQVA